MTWTKPHILLLDEPSNHLDIDACNALIEGLATFKGGVLMVRPRCLFPNTFNAVDSFVYNDYFSGTSGGSCGFPTGQKLSIYNCTASTAEVMSCDLPSYLLPPVHMSLCTVLPLTQVSHDQYLIEATVDELWMCENGNVTPWRGTFQEYKARLKTLSRA